MISIRMSEFAIFEELSINLAEFPCMNPSCQLVSQKKSLI